MNRITLSQQIDFWVIKVYWGFVFGPLLVSAVSIAKGQSNFNAHCISIYLKRLSDSFSVTIKATIPIEHVDVIGSLADSRLQQDVLIEKQRRIYINFTDDYKPGMTNDEAIEISTKLSSLNYENCCCSASELTNIINTKNSPSSKKKKIPLLEGKHLIVSGLDVSA